MKRKLLLSSLALCMTGTLLTGSLMARDDASSPSDPSAAGGTGSSSSQSSGGSSSSDASSTGMTPTGSQWGSQKPERVTQQIGAPVKDASGDTLGQISDFIISPAGRIQFAILSLSDPAESGKMTAVPWMLIHPGAEPNSFTASVSKQKLSGAQTFDASNWPDFSQAEWNQKIYSYYGIQPPSRMGGHIPTGGSESGAGGSQQPSGSPGSSGDSGNGGGSSPDQGSPK